MSARSRAASIAVHAALVVGAIVTLTPLLSMVSASFMPTGQATSTPPPLLPRGATLLHYRELVTHLRLGHAFLNSVFVASAITVCSVLTNSLAGYAFAKFRFPGRSALFRFLLLGLVIPTQAGMLPLFVLMKRLHLVNSYWGVIVPSMATLFGIFLIRQYVLSIPNAILDAARIDGASEFRIYRSIVLPLAAPMLVTLALFVFMGAWNDFLWPLIILSDGAKYTLPVALANLSGEHVQDTELMMAGAVVTVIPVLIVFIALQRYYIRGITVGAVTG